MARKKRRLAESFVLAAEVTLLVSMSLPAWAVAEVRSEQHSTFSEHFEVMWATDHVKPSADGRMWNLVLDQTSDKTSFIHLSSNSEHRDEFNFEFLGNRSGQPYTLQTNVYVNGVGGREQRMSLWFDPTYEFHTYSILFYVDQVPIRVHKNTVQTRSMYPSKQPMYVFSSIWNGDDWATRGGLDKINWDAAPFVSTYEKFHVDACDWNDADADAWTLGEKEKALYVLATSKYMQYNYCTDVARYARPPPECNVL
ncbi:hypothetical protein KP509_19G055800 [Ceratopteris richardii]|uniref:Xyloglucan endotransglucosylase/hydrolase n=1 Tax=Ceratopteris richardii TaxID=49495 RepID=A0A8T2SNT1_CERRI|nr:hypothetical protein KP509_19G055800 [Ceratopteris richardii]